MDNKCPKNELKTVIQDIKALMSDLKKVYVAVDDEMTLYELDKFAGICQAFLKKSKNSAAHNLCGGI